MSLCIARGRPYSRNTSTITGPASHTRVEVNALQANRYWLTLSTIVRDSSIGRCPAGTAPCGRSSSTRLARWPYSASETDSMVQDDGGWVFDQSSSAQQCIDCAPAGQRQQRILILETAQDLLRPPSITLTLGRNQLFDLFTHPVRTAPRRVRSIFQPNTALLPIPFTPKTHRRPAHAIAQRYFRHRESPVQCHHGDLFAYVHDRSLQNSHLESIYPNISGKDLPELKTPALLILPTASENTPATLPAARRARSLCAAASDCSRRRRGGSRRLRR